MSAASLEFPVLRAGYADGSFRPLDIVESVFERIAKRHPDPVWISIREKGNVLREAELLEKRREAGETLPLYGIPFAVKDNIDVAGLPTTAACPAFSYEPAESAPCVQRLVEAGALVIGKTNLDQFATGLVGIRSPYGVPKNPFDPDYIPGGSSSGSAVAVSAGVVSFALGTDTAGSGRVPAGFNHIVGLKPSRGFLSTRGVVPACRTLDCVSVFALTCEDAGAVLAVAGVYDPEEPYSRKPGTAAVFSGSDFRFGVPENVEFFGDTAAARHYEESLGRLEALGGKRVPIDFGVFEQTAALLYQGPWIAERWAALRDFHATNADAILPVTRKILESGSGLDAADLFAAQYRLAALRREALGLWEKMNFLCVPSSPSIYTVEAVEADPIALNTRLGTYTNFANLQDLCGVAMPSTFRTDGLPAGVTILAPAWSEASLLKIADLFHRNATDTLGATGCGFASLDLATGSNAR